MGRRTLALVLAAASPGIAAACGVGAGASAGDRGATPGADPTTPPAPTGTRSEAPGRGPVIDLVATVGDPPRGVRRIHGGALALERTDLLAGPTFAGPFRPGSRTFLAVTAGEDGAYDLALVDVDEPSRRTPVAEDLPAVRWPTFTPDGTVLVFGGLVDGTGAILRVGVEDGTAEPLVTSPEGVFDPTVTYDGRWVVYAASSRSGLRLARVHLGGGAPEPFATGGVRPYGTPRASPAEDLVAFVGFAEPGRLRVFAVEPGGDGAPAVRAVSPEPGTRGSIEHLAFSADGTRLAYVVAEAPAPRVEVVEVATGRRVLRTPAGRSAQHPAFGPAGRLLAFTAADAGRPAVTVLRISDGARIWSEPGLWLARFVPPPPDSGARSG